MSPWNVLITGCNRGIGLELAKYFAREKPTNLFVTCRDPSKAEELAALAKANSNVHILSMDVTDHSSYDRVAKAVSDQVGDAGLHVLVNNAGVLPSERSKGLSPDMMREAYEVNCIGPLFFTKKLLPLVEKAAAKRSDLPMGIKRAAVVMMSTKVASIDDNSGGGNYAYRCSKIALNMAMKNLSIEMKDRGVLVMSMHPGWVQTSMGGGNALIDTDTCVSNMMETLAGLSEKDQASFLTYDNKPIKW